MICRHGYHDIEGTPISEGFSFRLRPSKSPPTLSHLMEVLRMVGVKIKTTFERTDLYTLRFGDRFIS